MSRTLPLKVLCKSFQKNRDFMFFLTDVDECILGTHDCLADIATCTNTYGTYSCACNPGYVGDGKTNCEIIAPGRCHGYEQNLRSKTLLNKRKSTRSSGNKGTETFYQDYFHCNKFQMSVRLF